MSLHSLSGSSVLVYNLRLYLFQQIHFLLQLGCLFIQKQQVLINPAIYTCLYAFNIMTSVYIDAFGSETDTAVLAPELYLFRNMYATEVRRVTFDGSRSLRFIIVIN